MTKYKQVWWTVHHLIGKMVFGDYLDKSKCLVSVTDTVRFKMKNNSIKYCASEEEKLSFTIPKNHIDSVCKLVHKKKDMTTTSNMYVVKESQHQRCGNSRPFAY